MADYSGIQTKFAFRKERGLYGAGPAIAYPDTPGATDLGAGNLVPYSNEGLQRKQERTTDDSLAAQGSPFVPDVYKDLGGGPVSHKLHWRDFESLIMCALGFEHPDDSPATIVAGAYCHLFEMDYSLHDQAWASGDERAPGAWSSNDRKVRRGLVGVAKGLSDWVYYSSFINTMTITGTPSDGVVVEFEFVSYARLRGSYNSGSWARRGGNTKRVLFSQSKVNFGLRSLGDASLPAMRVNKWMLKLDNKMGLEDQTTETDTGIEIPMRTEQAEVMLSLELPRYRTGDDTDLSYIDIAGPTIDLAGKIVLTGPEIGATGENHKIGFFMSRMHPDQNPYEAPVDGGGPIRQVRNFKAYQPGGSDIFATNHYNLITQVKDSALVVTMHNEDSVNYLLET